MRCRALLAARSPPRERRCRVVFPEEAGMGATPLSMANAASQRSRSAVGAGGDEQLCSGVGAHAVGGAQCGIERGGQGVDFGGQLVGLAFEELDALRQGLAGDQHRLGDRVFVSGGPAPGQGGHQPQRGRVAAVVLTQVGGAGDEEVLDLLDRRGTGFDRAAARGQQGLERLGVGILGYGQAVTGQHRPRRSVGVQWIGLALTAPGGPIRAVDLDDMNIAVLQRLGEPGTVGTGALDTGDEHLPEAARPADGDVVAGRVGAELGVAERLASVGDCRDVDGVEVGVDADDDALWGCHDGWCPLRAMNRAAGDDPGGRTDKTLMRNGQAPD